MPVVRIDLKRFGRMVGTSREKVIERLPYIGLDIESREGDLVRVEYSPNRPDFGTDYGIARALRGLLGKEVGLPTYASSPSGVTVSVDRRLASVRPYIACAVASGLDLDDEDVRQLISLQEDLHNGLGRRRRKVAIGLHDGSVLDSPISYRAVSSTFGFVPLDCEREMKIGEILTQTEQGMLYGGIVSRSRLFPVIVDSSGTVLSFPPVINGSATRLSSKTRDVFVDVTGTDTRSVDDVLAILATTLSDMGGRIGSVRIAYGEKRRTTPDLTPSEVPLDMEAVRSVTGLALSRSAAIECLRKSRLGVRGSKVTVPRYRVDILHRVDIAEEVALGYGVDRLSPVYPVSNQPGLFNPFDQFLDKTSDVMAASGMVEQMSYELTDERSLYAAFGRSPDRAISVENPRSSEHAVLRDSLVPSLMGVLARNVKEEYPQRLFEVGRTYAVSGESVSESWLLGCLIAHSQATYTEAKMHMEAFVRLMTGGEATARQSRHWAFADGRSADVLMDGRRMGVVGEVKPEVLAAFGVTVPVSGFELDISLMHKQLK